MADDKDVAFLGLGAMGFGMASHLASAGYRVAGFDVWAPTLDRFAATVAGGTAAASPAAAARGRRACVVMVATAQQAQAVLLDGADPAVPALGPGALLLLCSTVPAAYVLGLAARLARDRPDIRLVDCPVSGGVRRAAAGTLSIMASAGGGGSGGSDDDDDDGAATLDLAGPLLRALSDPAKLYIVRPGGVGAGSNAKMVHQVLAAVQILAASEALGLASHLGIGLPREGGDGGGDGAGAGAAAATAAAIQASEAQAWMFDDRLPRLLAADHGPVASALTIILKDAGIITAEARRHRFPAPMASAAEQAYLAALGRGLGARDDTVMVDLYREGMAEGARPASSSESDSPAAEEREGRLGLVVALLKGIHLCAAAEALAFARRCGLDLDQILDLCVNAAGGSAVLARVGPAIVRALRGEKGEARAEGDDESLQDAARDLAAAAAEAQARRMPLPLGSAALALINGTLLRAEDPAPRAAVVRAWDV